MVGGLEEVDMFSYLDALYKRRQSPDELAGELKGDY